MMKRETLAIADIYVPVKWRPPLIKKAPQADSKEWEGKPDKLQYFSPNPGAGD
jgi:Domain of unknown function (DUF3470)